MSEAFAGVTVFTPSFAVRTKPQDQLDRTEKKRDLPPPTSVCPDSYNICSKHCEGVQLKVFGVFVAEMEVLIVLTCMITVNNVQRSVFAGHYGVTVKLTFELLEIEKVIASSFYNIYNN